MGFEKNKKLIIDFGNEPTTATFGDRTFHFKSKGECRLAKYFEILKIGGHIENWFYEKTKFVFPRETAGAKQFTVDFTIFNHKNTIEYFEYKGWLRGVDITKFRRLQEYYPDTKITLVMSGKAKKDANRIRMISKYCYEIRYANEMLKGV